VHNTIQLVALDSLEARGPSAFGDVAPLFGWWQPAAGPVTAALMHTPPYPVLLTRLPANAAGDLAEALAGRGRQLPGVNAGTQRRRDVRRCLVRADRRRLARIPRLPAVPARPAHAA
jgi:hypothetical protein